MINMAKPQIGDDEKKAVMEVLDSGIIAQGPRTKAFEEAFAGMCTTRHAIATSSEQQRCMLPCWHTRSSR